MDQPLPNDQTEVDSFPLVCEVCKEKNLSTSIDTISCLRCNKITCFHMISPVDPAYCNECVIDVQMTEQTIYKKTEHYNEETDKTYVKSSKARQIQFTGLDWLFFNRRINTLSDTELLLAIEYHQAIYHSMMYEREKRRVDYFHRNAGKKVIIKTTSAETTTETTIKKSRTIKPDSTTKAQANLKALLEMLIKQGKTPAEIMQMMGVK